MMKVLFPLFFAFAATLADLSANTITWSAVQPSAGATDVDVSGTLKIAQNFGNNGTASPTVNGVTFNWALPPGWSSGGITGGLAGTDTGDSGYNTLLNNGIGANGSTANPTPIGAFRLDALIPSIEIGHTYLIQVWYTDQRTNSFLYDRRMQLNSVGTTLTVSNGLANATQVPNIDGGGTVPVGTPADYLEADPDNEPATGAATDAQFGSFVKGTWTADGNPLYLLVQGSNPSNPAGLRAALSGLQIRDVPPSMPFAITDFNVTQPDMVNITFDSTPGNQDEIFSGTDLAALTQSEGTVIATTASTSFTRTAVLTTREFFRVADLGVAPPPPPLFSADFETDAAGFTHTNIGGGTDWSLGKPDSTGGGTVTAGHSGTNCWATGLGDWTGSGDPGCYYQNTDAVLSSPVIDLTGVSAASLRFAQAMDILPGHTAVVNIIDDASGSIIETIHTSTPDTEQSSSSWTTVGPLAIPAAALNRPVRIEWRFTGNGDGTYMGWYIDDVVVTRP